MTEKSSELSSRVRLQEKYPDISQELFGMYKKRYIEEKEGITDKIYSQLQDLKNSFLGMFGSTPEKIREPKHDELKLSLIAKDYLDKNHTELKGENPDRSCIIIYFPGGSKEKSQARQICIPRANPENKMIQVSGFTLTPVPKSNGYNTEYIIKDKNGRSWSQLAILFPAENPKYTRMRLLHEEQTHLRKEIISLEATFSYMPKKKKTERRDLQEKITGLKLKFAQIRIMIDTLGSPEMYTHFSYVPYRESLNTEQNKKQGFEYLVNAMQKTYTHSVEKKTLGVMKSNSPGLSIAEAIPWQYPSILNLIERMDFEEYFDSTGTNLKLAQSNHTLMDAQIGKSLTTFGINTSHAFNWQRSRVGAQGIGQIMPSTYALYRNNSKYGPLFPESDFDIAARDHETSFRLQVAHFDDQIHQFPDVIKKNWTVLIRDKDTRIGIISLLAAGYNGSMKRIMDEVFGDISKDTTTLEMYKKRLSSKSIMKAMEQAKDRDIASIHDANKPKPYKDKKTKKLIYPKEHPLSKEQQEKVQKRMAMYKESMTYVLKAEYVWQYLSKKYPEQF